MMRLATGDAYMAALEDAGVAWRAYKAARDRWNAFMYGTPAEMHEASPENDSPKLTPPHGDAS